MTTSSRDTTPRFPDSYWYILGTAVAYAELIDRGVRPLAELTLIFEPASQLDEQLPHLRAALKDYRVNTVQHTIMRNADQAAIRLFLYSSTDPANRKQAQELLDLFKQLKKRENYPHLNLHRKIGQMLGYSELAIEEHISQLRYRNP